MTDHTFKSLNVIRSICRKSFLELFKLSIIIAVMHLFTTLNLKFTEEMREKVQFAGKK